MSTGGRVARRALRRWSWRLYRRAWRQRVLVLALITVAVAASVFGATAAYNLPDSRVAEFGSADHRFETAVATPAEIEPDLAEAEEWFGTIEVIGHQVVPIPGTTKLYRLEENIGAAFVSLTPEDLRSVEEALSKITVHGARYSADRQKLVSR